MNTLIYSSQEQTETPRFTPVVALAIPLVAIFLQAFLPLRIPFLRAFDLPLLVTIYFAVGRRNPVSGLLTGAAIGLLQDALTNQPIGVFGIVKTIVGFTGSSLGVRVDVDSLGTRFLVTFGFSLLQSFLYLVIIRSMLASSESWRWPHEAGRALANAFLGLVVYALLDTFRQRQSI